MPIANHRDEALRTVATARGALGQGAVRQRIAIGKAMTDTSRMETDTRERPGTGQAGLGAALVATGLTKVFRDPWTLRSKTAVEDVSLTVERGETFGLLGPNGAGKTTTLKLLLGLLRPTAGRAWLLGEPAGSPGSRVGVGYLPENPYFSDRLTAREFLTFSGQLAGLAQGEARRLGGHWLERLSLAARADTQLRKFSKGMLQRVGLAHALLGDPELVFLDEPMSGLDPLGRREVRDLILECQERGVTVVFSSHILPDVELLCERVAVLAHGRVARMGPLDELLETGEHGSEVVARGPQPLLLPPRLAGVTHEVHGRRVVLRATTAAALGELLAYLPGAGYEVESVTPARRSLESVVLEVAAASGEAEVAARAPGSGRRERQRRAG
jgi:ABC-2 type transport system ATP-binding protein